MQATLKLLRSFIGHNFGDYKNPLDKLTFVVVVLSVTILETTKTVRKNTLLLPLFYRSQFWRLQKHIDVKNLAHRSFIGHNFGDYKNHLPNLLLLELVLSVTILETTKTDNTLVLSAKMFYRSQFWRLQKLLRVMEDAYTSFIGHNFGDYKNKPSMKKW